MACLESDVEKVRTLLTKNRISPNFYFASKSTPLITACKHDRLDIIKLLLENGARVNEPDGNDNTALFYVCKTGNMEALNYYVIIMQMLIKLQ